LALITFKTKIKLFLNIALPMLGIAIFRLLTFDTDIQIREYLSEINEYALVFTPILNERLLIFFVGSIIIFVIARITLKINRNNIAKVLGVIGILVELS
jgi:hypothetical protein